MHAVRVKHPTEEDKLNLARTENLDDESVDSFKLDFKTKFFELVSDQGPLKIRGEETSAVQQFQWTKLC